MLCHHIVDLVTSALKTGVACSCHIPAQQNVKKVHTDFFLSSRFISNNVKIILDYCGSRMPVATKRKGEQYFT